jgi:hypothetical protein
MTAFAITLMLVPIIAAVLVVLNYALAPHRPVFTKKGTYECGLLARSSQSRQPFSVLFYVVACLYMVSLPLPAMLRLVKQAKVWPTKTHCLAKGSRPLAQRLPRADYPS